MPATSSSKLTIPFIQRILFFACDSFERSLELTNNVSSIFAETGKDYSATPTAWDNLLKRDKTAAKKNKEDNKDEKEAEQPNTEENKKQENNSKNKNPFTEARLNTILYAACKKGITWIVAAFLHNRNWRRKLIKPSGTCPIDPLSVAAREGQFEVVKDVFHFALNLRDQHHQYSTEEEKEFSLELLLKNDRAPRCPLFEACLRNRLDIVSFIINDVILANKKKGPDDDEEDHSCSSALLKQLFFPSGKTKNNVLMWLAFRTTVEEDNMRGLVMLLELAKKENLMREVLFHQDDSDATILHYAVASDSIESFKKIASFCETKEMLDELMQVEEKNSRTVHALVKDCSEPEAFKDLFSKDIGSLWDEVSKQ